MGIKIWQPRLGQGGFLLSETHRDARLNASHVTPASLTVPSAPAPPSTQPVSSKQVKMAAPGGCAWQLQQRKCWEMQRAAVRWWQSSRQAQAGVIPYNHLNTFSAARQRRSNLLPPPPDRPLVGDFKLALDQLKGLADCLNSVTQTGAAAVWFLCCSLSVALFQVPVLKSIKFWENFSFFWLCTEPDKQFKMCESVSSSIDFWHLWNIYLNMISN